VNSLCEALMPQSRRSEVQVNSPASRKTYGHSPELMATNKPGGFGAQSQSAEKDGDRKPPRPIAKMMPSLEQWREARKHRDEVLIFQGKQADRDNSHDNVVDWLGIASRVQLRKTLEQQGVDPVIARGKAGTAAASPSVQALEDWLCRVSPGEKSEPLPHILAGQNDANVVDCAIEPSITAGKDDANVIFCDNGFPATTAGSHSTDNDMVLYSEPPKKYHSKKRGI
jgi:hypothetical protein